MVESREPSEGNQSLDQVNFDQLVHVKAFQEGYLKFDQKYKSVPGYFWGERR